MDDKKATLPACCDIYEKDGKIILKMDMPGVSKDDIDVNIENDILKVTGRKKGILQAEGEYLIREIRQADYSQSYTLDETIDRTNINASIQNGVLTISLAVKEAEKPRKITVIAK